MPEQEADKRGKGSQQDGKQSKAHEHGKQALAKTNGYLQIVGYKSPRLEAVVERGEKSRDTGCHFCASRRQCRPDGARLDRGK